MFVKHAQNLSAEATTPNRFPSESIWGSFPMAEHLANPGKYFHWFDDFSVTPSLTSATTAVNRYAYMSYIDTSNTIATLLTEKMLGVLRLSADATDNDSPTISLAGDSVPVMISDTAGDDMPLWFEGRWRKSSVTDNQAAMFLGLTEETRCVDNGVLIDDTGVLADIDHIGFNVAHDNGEELNFAWVKSGQTDVELMAALDSLVASTWYKSGFRYVPSNDTTKRIVVYQNQVEQSTYGTGTQISNAAFPDGEEQTFTCCLKTGEATAVTLDLDWVRLAQKMRDT